MHDDLTERLKAEGLRLGFDRLGVAPAVAPPGHPRLLDWLDAGRQAGMDYMRRQAEARAHPSGVQPGVRSVVVASLVYGRPEPVPPGPTQGKVARYARGSDYHEVLWRKLGQLLDWLKAECPGATGRAVADSAPLAERDFARLAGMGWIGKNTMLIDRTLGSFTVLGALLVDVDLRPDVPFQADHCGTCTRCLDACPTSAFDAPGVLDARKCISYWTIEHKGAVDEQIAERIDGWAFGCDVCQDVCPWNRKAPPGREPALDPVPGRTNPDLIGWLDADPAALRAEIKGTALARTKRAGLVRNAALVLGQRREPLAAAPLARRMADADAAVRAAAAWALGQIGGPSALSALRSAEVDEQDPATLGAIRRALTFADAGEADD
jgi:epoxyqueuosine reductase